MKTEQELLAVIFDVDGVLVKSMEKHAEAYAVAFAVHGVTIAQGEVFRNEGRGSRDVAASLARERALGLTEQQIDAIAREKQRVFVSFGPMPKYPGVDELVAQLVGRGVRLAMVTGTNRANLKNHFGAWLENFEVIVCADDVTHTKPHPEPYLKALEKLGVAARSALVIENAPLGIQSAKAAGLRVIAITTTNPPDALKQADLIVGSIEEVAL